jgi:hypothetical protein
MIAAVSSALAASALLWLACSAEAGPRPKAVRSTLKGPAEIEGVPCAAGYVWRFEDGTLSRCTLEQDATVRGARLPKGSTVAFNPDRSHAYVFLPRTTEIQGYLCRGSGHNFMTVFHPDGALKLCWMPDDREVQGIPCAGFSIWSDVFGGNPSGVHLHPGGQLAECRVTADVTVDGTLFKKGQRIRLDADRHPVSATGTDREGR